MHPRAPGRLCASHLPRFPPGLLFLRALPSVSMVTAQSSAATTQAIDTTPPEQEPGCGFSETVLVSSILPLVHTRTSVCQAVFSGSG